MDINVQSIIESSVILGVLSWIIWGLKEKIKVLNNTVDAQKKTLEVMDKRNAETEKISDIYKDLINELPNTIKNFKQIIKETTDATINQLEEAVKIKDAELEKLRKNRLKKLDTAQKAVDKVESQVTAIIIDESILPWIDFILKELQSLIDRAPFEIQKDNNFIQIKRIASSFRDAALVNNWKLVTQNLSMLIEIINGWEGLRYDAIERASLLEYCYDLAGKLREAGITRNVPEGGHVFIHSNNRDF